MVRPSTKCIRLLRDMKEKLILKGFINNHNVNYHHLVNSHYYCNLSQNLHFTGKTGLLERLSKLPKESGKAAFEHGSVSVCLGRDRFSAIIMLLLLLLVHFQCKCVLFIRLEE